MKKFLLLCLFSFVGISAFAQGFANETVNGGGKSSSNYSSAPVKFQGYVNASALASTARLGGLWGYGVGPGIDVSAGIMLFDHFYIGAEAGFQAMFEKYQKTDIVYGTTVVIDIESISMNIPVGLNLKGYITRDKRVNPFINCSVGALFAGNEDFSDFGFGGMLGQAGIGVEWKRLSVGVGYNMMLPRLGSIHHGGYLKIGFRFGKN